MKSTVPFGGKIVLFVSGFRQNLPIGSSGGRAAIGCSQAFTEWLLKFA